MYICGGVSLLFNNNTVASSESFNVDPALFIYQTQYVVLKGEIISIFYNLYPSKRELLEDDCAEITPYTRTRADVIW